MENHVSIIIIPFAYPVANLGSFKVLITDKIIYIRKYLNISNLEINFFLRIALSIVLCTLLDFRQKTTGQLFFFQPEVAILIRFNFWYEKELTSLSPTRSGKRLSTWPPASNSYFSIHSYIYDLIRKVISCFLLIHSNDIVWVYMWDFIYNITPGNIPFVLFWVFFASRFKLAEALNLKRLFNIEDARLRKYAHLWLCLLY